MGVGGRLSVSGCGWEGEWVGVGGRMDIGEVVGVYVFANVGM